MCVPSAENVRVRTPEKTLLKELLTSKDHTLGAIKEVVAKTVSYVLTSVEGKCTRSSQEKDYFWNIFSHPNVVMRSQLLTCMESHHLAETTSNSIQVSALTADKGKKQVPHPDFIHIDFLQGIELLKLDYITN